MGKRTGRPRGRPAGAKNQHTKERETRIAEAAAAVEDVIPNAFKGDAHALLIAVYKDPENELNVRLDAAKAAIGYEKPRLAAVEHSGGLEIVTHEQALEELEGAAAAAVAVNGHMNGHAN